MTTVTVANLVNTINPDGSFCASPVASRAIVRSVEGGIAIVQYLTKSGDYNGLLRKLNKSHIGETRQVEIDEHTGNLIGL